MRKAERPVCHLDNGLGRGWEASPAWATLATPDSLTRGNPAATDRDDMPHPQSQRASSPSEKRRVPQRVESPQRIADSPKASRRSIGRARLRRSHRRSGATGKDGRGSATTGGRRGALSLGRCGNPLTGPEFCPPVGCRDSRLAGALFSLAGGGVLSRDRGDAVAAGGQTISQNRPKMTLGTIRGAVFPPN